MDGCVGGQTDGWMKSRLLDEPFMFLPLRVSNFFLSLK